MRIAELNLSVRSRNALGRAGVRTLAQLQRMSVADLMRIRGIGTKCADEIQTFLKMAGETGLQDTTPPLNVYEDGWKDGVERMRTAVIQELKAMAGESKGVQSAALTAVIPVIRKLEVL